jgi:hypothetical protein
MEELAGIEGTTGRIQAIYDVILPALAARYRYYLENSDSLLDEPSFRVIERALDDYARMQLERAEVCEELKGTLTFDSTRARDWSRQEAGISEMVAHGSGSTLAQGAAV